MTMTVWGKPRWRILRDGLRAAGATVLELHASVWEGIDDKTQVRGRGRRLRLLARWLASYPALLWRFLLSPRPDLVLSGINHGANVGRAVLHSGTVGAALTAKINDTRALAVSLDVALHPTGERHWETVAGLVAPIEPDHPHTAREECCQHRSGVK